MSEEIKETKQEVSKKEPSILSWLDYKYDGIDDTLKGDNILKRYISVFESFMNRTYKKYDFLSAMVSAPLLEFVVSTQSMSEVISYTRYPYFRQLKMVDTIWDVDKMHILMPTEIRNFALYLCENEHNFLYIMNTYQNNVECEIIKFTILNDYLTNNLSADEEAIFKECEKEYLNNLGFIPNGYQYTPGFKVGVFLNMFFHTDEDFENRIIEPRDFLDKDWYGDFIYNRFKSMNNGEKLWYFYGDTAPFMASSMYTVYQLFHHVDNRSIYHLEEYIKKYHLEHSKKLMLLVETCHMIIDYWDKLRIETSKKFKLDYISKVDIHICNNVYFGQFILERFKEYNNSNFEKFYKGSSSYFSAMGITHSHLDINGDSRLKVFVSMDLMIRRILDEWNGLSKDEIFNDIQIILRHEMGHVVDRCIRLNNDGIEVCRYVMRANTKLKSRIYKEYRNTPENEKLDHTYWYYTCLPAERRANELMEIPIQDMYKAHNTPMPDSVKKLLNEGK